MTSVLIEVVVILMLVIANGVLAMTEIAVVSARKARLQQRANEGDVGARVALELSDNSAEFLASVQIGITLVGILAGTFAGATIADQLQSRLALIDILKPYAEAVSVAVVVVSITYLTLVAGELVPKRIALNHAEDIACLASRPMRLISRAAGPLVRFLTASTEWVLAVLGSTRSGADHVSEEEIKVLIEQGTQAGVFEQSEQEMVDEVLRLHDRTARELMTPRKEVSWLNAADPSEQTLKRMEESPHNRYPVCDGDLDGVLGFATARQILSLAVKSDRFDIAADLQRALFIPENKDVLSVLEMFKESKVHAALVVDEYGSVQGIITIMDILEAVVGDLSSIGEEPRWEAIQREDGSWLVDGSTPIEEFREVLEMAEPLPDEEEKVYHTVAGFLAHHLGHIPTEAEVSEWSGWRYEVVDMDGYRIDKILVSKLELPEADEATE